MEPHMITRLALVGAFAILLSISSCISVNVIHVPEECMRMYPGYDAPEHCEGYYP